MCITPLGRLRPNISRETLPLPYRAVVAVLTIPKLPPSMLTKARRLNPPVLGPPRGLSLQTLLITSVPKTMLVLTLVVCKVVVALAEKKGPLAL